MTAIDSGDNVQVQDTVVRTDTDGNLTFPTNRTENQPLRPGTELDLPAVPELTRLGPRPE